MVVMIYPAMQPVVEPTILELAKKVEELTKKIEEISVFQTEPVKVIFATGIFKHLKNQRSTECRIKNVTKKLAREMLIQHELFSYHLPCSDQDLNLPVPGKTGIWSIPFYPFNGDDEKYNKFLQMQRARIEEFFKDLNVPCTVVVFDGFMEEYEKQFV